LKAIAPVDDSSALFLRSIGNPRFARNSRLTIGIFRAFLILFQLHAHGAYPLSGYPLLLTLV